ncbi:hypothetical protein BT93_G0321 [Corymbia citriodora subsp. variegata]|nr:hypothetical protein BT93_G0321 [Corymbia citriodora subsp. variegata]
MHKISFADEEKEATKRERERERENQGGFLQRIPGSFFTNRSCSSLESISFPSIRMLVTPSYRTHHEPDLEIDR